LQHIVVWLASAPSPTPVGPPGFGGDPNTVSPGPWGFAAIFFVAALTILLLIDMTRRIRRIRYREEIRQLLEGESPEFDPPKEPPLD
jgi:hypothetical protein